MILITASNYPGRICSKNCKPSLCGNGNNCIQYCLNRENDPKEISENISDFIRKTYRLIILAGQAQKNMSIITSLVSNYHSSESMIIPTISDQQQLEELFRVSVSNRNICDNIVKQVTDPNLLVRIIPYLSRSRAEKLMDEIELTDKIVRAFRSHPSSSVSTGLLSVLKDKSLVADCFRPGQSSEVYTALAKRKDLTNEEVLFLLKECPSCVLILTENTEDEERLLLLYNNPQGSGFNNYQYKIIAKTKNQEIFRQAIKSTYKYLRLRIAERISDITDSAVIYTLCFNSSYQVRAEAAKHLTNKEILEKMLRKDKSQAVLYQVRTRLNKLDSEAKNKIPEIGKNSKFYGI